MANDFDENTHIRYAGEWFSFEYIQRSVWTRIAANTEYHRGCLLWTGSPGRGGYGRISIQSISGRKVSASPHRLVAILFYGDIGDLEVDHSCRNRKCCNIKHLTPMTGRLNTQLMHRRRQEDRFADQEAWPWRGEVE